MHLHASGTRRYKVPSLRSEFCCLCPSALNTAPCAPRTGTSRSLGTAHIPHPPIPVEESIFEAYLRFAFAYNLPTCSPPLSEQTRLAPSLRGLLHPGFQKFSHPHRRRILATGQVPLAVLTAYTR